MKTLAFRVILITAVAARGVSQTRLDLGYQTRDVDFSNAVTTKTVKTGSALPTSCASGELFFNVGASGTGLYTCASSNVWSPAGIPTVANHIGQVLTNDGSSPAWQSLAGDIAGPAGSTSVRGLQGRTVSSTMPTAGQVLGWNATTSSWQPINQTIPSAPNYAKSFVSSTLLTILGSEHGQGTANLIVSCWDGLSPANWIEPDSIRVDPVTFTVQIAFASAQTGRCVVNGSGGGGGGGGAAAGGGGAVASVFGRTGTITAQTGDYSFPQISGAVAVAQLPLGISAANIGSGIVGNAAFAALANVTGDIQGQLNGRAPAVHTHIGGGDIAGDVTNTTVTGLQHFPVAPLAPLNGQQLIFNGTAGQWQPQTVSGGGSGGASSSGQLSDLTVVFTSPTVLTIGSNCTTTTPCNMRFGTTVFSILSSATVTLTGQGSGTAYFYVTSDGILNAASLALPLSCSNTCTALTNIAQFPLNSIPLANWTVLNGQWTSGGGTDRRAFQSTNVVNGGTGIALVYNGTQTTVSVDANVVPTYLANSTTVTFPAIAATTCSDQALSLPGASLGDSVAPGWPALPSGLMGTMWVSAANTVAIRLCNLSSQSQTPGALTIRATDVRGF